jgi:hypothetical protein
VTLMDAAGYFAGIKIELQIDGYHFAPRAHKLRSIGGHLDAGC